MNKLEKLLEIVITQENECHNSLTDESKIKADTYHEIGTAIKNMIANEKNNSLVELLGSSNVDKIKSTITDMIIEAVRNDIQEYFDSHYYVDPHTILEFMKECENTAFDEIKEEIVSDIKNIVKDSVKGYNINEK